MRLPRGAVVAFVALLLTWRPIAAGPGADEVARAAAGMAAWAESPLAAAEQSATTCAALARLDRPVPVGALAPTSGVRALARFTASCAAYRQALAAYPLDRLRWERYWHESLKEGVMVASEQWRDEMVVSEGRLAALDRRWREATRAADEGHRLGCAALEAAGLAEDVRRPACDDRAAAPQ
jgi:hypothetical protein